MYAKYIDCPECNKKIFADAKNCNCGWKKSNSLEVRDHRCIFVVNGKRCSLPGMMSSATQKSDDGRCKYHFESRGDFVKSCRWIDFIENHFQEIIHFQKHYQTNFHDCERCRNLCGAEKNFLMVENKAL